MTEPTDFEKLRSEIGSFASSKLREGYDPHRIFMALQATAARIIQPTGMTKEVFLTGSGIAFGCAEEEHKKWSNMNKKKH